MEKLCLLISCNYFDIFYLPHSCKVLNNNNIKYTSNYQQI